MNFQCGDVSKSRSHELWHSLCRESGKPFEFKSLECVRLCDVYRFPPAPTGTVLLENHEHLFLDMVFALEGLRPT